MKMFKRLREGRDTGVEALDKAIEELAEARTQKTKALRIAKDLERDRRHNHYADMVRRALWVTK